MVKFWSQRYKKWKKKWKPYNKLMFWLAIIGIFLTLSFGGKYVFNFNKINQENSPGSIATIGQTGDNIIINPEVDIPEPTLSIKEISAHQLVNNLYKTELLLTIDSSVPIPQLYLEVKAPTITEMETVAQRTGGSMSGHSGLREGYAFTNLINAYGSYKIIILTKEKEFFNITYDY